MKRIIILIISIVFMGSIAFTSSAFASSEKKDFESANINDVKYKVEQYINMSMNKYDHTGTKSVCYDGIIKNEEFYSYAQKTAQLENNRYKAFPELRIEELTVNIEYNSIVAYGDGYTVDVVVYETKKYKAFEEPGYVCTKHLITVENIDGELYIADDVTNNYIDSALCSQGKENRLSAVDRIIELDSKEIEKTLSNEENNLNATREIHDNNDVQRSSTYSLNYNSMYQYAAKYNGASPNKVANRNPAYYDFDDSGGDCTNYVSQIIKAGGAPMDTTGSYQWYYSNYANRSASWIVVSHLYSYLVNNTGVGPQGYWMSNSPEYPATKGDIIQKDTNYDGIQNHTMRMLVL